MLIVDDMERSVIVDSVEVPQSSQYFWVLDLQMMDFTLTPLKLFEEQWCKAVAIEVEGFTFSIPHLWNILIVDAETSLLDVVSVGELAKKPYTVFVYDNQRSFGHAAPARITDMSVYEHVVNPSLNRHHMHCHPISQHRWVCVAPNDSYNKYLKDKVMGDIL